MLLHCAIEIAVFCSTSVAILLVFDSVAFRNSRIPKDPSHSPVKQISQQFRKSIARTPYCCGLCVRRYSIARLLRENRVGCRFGDLTDSRRVESKSSYSANHRRKIEIFGKRVSTGSRYRSEIAYYLEKNREF